MQNYFESSLKFRIFAYNYENYESIYLRKFRRRNK